MHGKSGTSGAYLAQSASRCLSPGETFLFIADADKGVGGSRSGRDPDQISGGGRRRGGRDLVQIPTKSREGGRGRDLVEISTKSRGCRWKFCLDLVWILYGWRVAIWRGSGPDLDGMKTVGRDLVEIPTKSRGDGQGSRSGRDPDQISRVWGGAGGKGIAMWVRVRLR